MSSPWWNWRSSVARECIEASSWALEHGARVTELAADGVLAVERPDRPAVRAEQPVPGELACARFGRQRRESATNDADDQARRAPRVEVVREVVMARTVGAGLQTGRQRAANSALTTPLSGS